MMRLSVVIPAFNAGALLAEAVRSVGAGERREVEILIVDDGSTDESAQAVAGWPAVRVLRQPNRGPGAARNLALGQARGEFAAFLDADDIWLPGRIESLLTADLAGAGAALFYSDYLLHDVVRGSTHPHLCPSLGEHPAPTILINNPIGTSTAVAPLSALQAAGGFRTDLRYGEDWDLWLRIAEMGPVRKLPGVWAEHRVRPGSLAGADRAELHRAEEAVLAAALTRRPELYRPVARAARSYLEFRSGIGAYRARDFGGARRHLTRSLLAGRYRPTLKYLVRSLVADAGLRRRAAARP
jgi:glycosyltransferase involved in cell wall biosynthesis